MPSRSLFELEQWKHPAAAYSQCPFWFWNDALDEKEILRQIADFQAHGVNAFVIHPRIGLPRKIRWLSDRFFFFVRVALKEARRRGMWVMLYDEAMYPSGSAGGLVAAGNPEFRARGLVCTSAGAGIPDQRRVATVSRHTGGEVTIGERLTDSVVRGIHYVGDENAAVPREEEPPAADLLNPEAVRSFIHLVYDRFFAEAGEYFGNTIKAIFTDEPNPLSRCPVPDAMPGSGDLLPYVSKRLGYDFTPHLPALWYDDEPDAARYRRDYAAAIAARLDEAYYRPLARWCEAHGVCLTGHPAEPTDLGHLRLFQIPGQDIVWRQIEPHMPSALEGAPATMAKAAASAAFHDGRARNLNEFAGAYGDQLTFEELRWLASWLLIRGCNLLVPHAFYYSMRGPRKAERPPDVGPNNRWWGDYKPWADATRRLCWINSVYEPVCHAAILGCATDLPWKAAKACFEAQIDFHYVEPSDLERATMENGDLRIGPGRYRALIVEEGFPLPAGFCAGVPIIRWERDGIVKLRELVAPVAELDQPAPVLRARHMRKGSVHLFLFFNEGGQDVTRRVHLPVEGKPWRLDVVSGEKCALTANAPIRFPSDDWIILLVEPSQPKIHWFEQGRRGCFFQAAPAFHGRGPVNSTKPLTPTKPENMMEAATRDKGYDAAGDMNELTSASPQ